MIILGIDPGETLIGFGVIEEKNTNLSLIDYGNITITSLHTTTAKKLLSLEKKLTILIKKYHPHVVVVEELFFVKNLKTGIRVAQARGVILVTCERNRIPVAEFTPLQIKQAVTGYGKADKKQVQRMIGIILHTEKNFSQDDAADAIAAAICGSNTTLYRHHTPKSYPINS